MLLSLAVLTNLAAACAPAVSASDLAAIATTESGRDPLAIHDNTTGRAHHPGEAGQAITLANQLLSEGHSVDLGLMQINAANFGWLNLSVATAFDPCASLRAAAAHLTAISRYNTGSPSRGFANGYVARVVAVRQRLAEPLAEAPHQSPSAAAPDPFLGPGPTPGALVFPTPEAR